MRAMRYYNGSAVSGWCLCEACWKRPFRNERRLRYTTRAGEHNRKVTEVGQLIDTSIWHKISKDEQLETYFYCSHCGAVEHHPGPTNWERVEDNPDAAIWMDEVQYENDYNDVPEVWDLGEEDEEEEVGRYFRPVGEVGINDPF